MRSSTWSSARVVVGSVVILAGLAFRVAAQVSHVVFEPTPRAFISSELGGDFTLGAAIADSTRRILSRRIPHSSLWVIQTKDVWNSLSGDRPPPPPLPLTDLREWGKQLGAAVTIDITATQSPSGVRLRPVRLLRSAAPVDMAPIVVADVAAAVQLLATRIANDPLVPRAHVRPPCSTNVFRDEQVDRAARYIMSAGIQIYPVDSTHPMGNLAKFVVNASGRVEPTTFEIVEASDSSVMQTARSELNRWRFIPARAGACNVRIALLTWIGR